MKRLTSFLSVLLLVMSFSLPLTTFALSAQQVYAKVKGSIYTLYSFDYHTRRVKARGTAVAVSKHLLATNCHVALSGNYLVVKINKKPKVARLFYKNEKQDLCLLKITDVNFSPVAIRNSGSVKIGEIVYAIGNPKGTEKTLSKGIISNKHKVKNGVWLQTDAAIYYGSSGGGLFDNDGRLIGVTTKMGGNFGFAIPTEWVLSALSTEDARAHDSRQKIVVDKKGVHQHSQGKAKKAKKSSHAIAGLSHVGTYGRNEVGLYRNNRECFIMIPGRGRHGQISSVTLWNPRFPKTMVIFAGATTAKQAMQVIYRAVVEKKTKQQQGYRSDSSLFLAGQACRLYGTRTSSGKYPFFVARFNKSPINLLVKVRQFSFQFKDPDPEIGSMKTVYKMDGFDKASAEYKANCK